MSYSNKGGRIQTILNGTISPHKSTDTFPMNLYESLRKRSLWCLFKFNLEKYTSTSQEACHSSCIKLFIHWTFFAELQPYFCQFKCCSIYEGLIWHKTVKLNPSVYHNLFCMLRGFQILQLYKQYYKCT